MVSGKASSSVASASCAASAAAASAASRSAAAAASAASRSAAAAASAASRSRRCFPGFTGLRLFLPPFFFFQVFGPPADFLPAGAAFSVGAASIWSHSSLRPTVTYTRPFLKTRTLRKSGHASASSCIVLHSKSSMSRSSAASTSSTCGNSVCLPKPSSRESSWYR